METILNSLLYSCLTRVLTVRNQSNNFNAYFGAHEKSGGRVPSSRSCNNFNVAMTSCNLTCLYPKRAFYTWTNNWTGNQKIDIRLDRAFLILMLLAFGNLSSVSL